MTRSPPQNSSMDTDELRKRAEQRLATKKHSGKVEDAQKLLHELRVHHIELEMQAGSRYFCERFFRASC